MADYTALATRTQDIIKDKGVVCSVQRLGADTTTYEKKYDPSTMSHYWEDINTLDRYDSPPTGSTLTWSGYAVVSKWPYKMIDGENVLHTDIKLLVSVSEKIRPGDTVVIQGISYQVVQPVDPVSPDAQTIIVQIVNARRA